MAPRDLLLENMKLLVTAGPTREPIDPVRFISNRSSGKMGYAVARAAARRDHKVVLVSGPVCLDPLDRADLVMVNTADEMLDAVRSRVGWCDALIMVAAVADWRPVQSAAEKIKKDDAAMVLRMEPTPDILRSVMHMKGNRTFVGFAAETGDPLREAARKLRSKGLDLIVANDVTEPGAGFEVDTNRVILVAADGAPEALPLMTKDAIALRIVEWVERARARHEGREGGESDRGQ